MDSLNRVRVNFKRGIAMVYSYLEASPHSQQFGSNGASYTLEARALFHGCINVQLVGSQMGTFVVVFFRLGVDLFADDQTIFHGLRDGLVAANRNLLVIKRIIVSCEPDVPETKRNEGVPVHPMVEILVSQTMSFIYLFSLINIANNCCPLVITLFLNGILEVE
ncbi:hypothetical protein KY285_004847 [Solanum tuberosum]|nr:hypothetical protein KY289_005287 [Solanum tuberosum]KAH0751699.1 hypothetical protein KY285_004847 [Solanum tuberosum]